MTWNLFGQILNFIAASVLIIRLLWLKWYANYRAVFVFIAVESMLALIFIVLWYMTKGGVKFPDYRELWCVQTWLEWGVEIWMVYALLTAILKQLPGILRFSLRVLNVTFTGAFLISLATVRSQYIASMATFGDSTIGRFASFTFSLERATAFALLLAILCILAFVLFFPIRVPRNLAAVSTGLCLTLFVRIGSILVKIYLPQFDSPPLESLDQLVTAGCMGYWVFVLNEAGDEASVTLGRGWQTVPQDRLVRQLEAMNTALLGSRERT